MEEKRRFTIDKFDPIWKYLKYKNLQYGWKIVKETDNFIEFEKDQEE